MSELEPFCVLFWTDNPGTIIYRVYLSNREIVSDLLKQWFSLGKDHLCATFRSNSPGIDQMVTLIPHSQFIDIDNLDVNTYQLAEGLDGQA